jgi:hypothetical protein
VNTEKVTRFEVIDENGRPYVRYGVAVRLLVQDDGQTLKVFVRKQADPIPKFSVLEWFNIAGRGLIAAVTWDSSIHPRELVGNQVRIGENVYHVTGVETSGQLPQQGRAQIGLLVREQEQAA